MSTANTPRTGLSAGDALRPTTDRRHHSLTPGSAPGLSQSAIVPPGAAGQRGPRSSADVAALQSMQAAAFAQAGRAGPRPSSELLSTGINLHAASPETEVLDRWFNDLSSYEVTLEEMAAASLDPNFKEELTAIESWFKVLSEAERTGALYQLLQTCNSVQVRFFIQVLSQMAKSDPYHGVLSPGLNQTASMEQQMEAKLAGMSLKSPSSPAGQRYGRQSLGPDTSAGASFLSPHDQDGAAAMLASQRARLKAQRTSAPGTFSASTADMLKSPVWSGDNGVSTERSRSPSPSPSAGRPKSTGSDATYLRSPNANAMDTQLSPLVGGSWASMVNTPLVPMFAPKDDEPTSPNLDTANARLQGWGRDQPASAQQQQVGANGIVLDDARKFRRTGRQSGSGPAGLGALPQGPAMGALGSFGGGDGGGNGLAAPAGSAGVRRASGGASTGPGVGPYARAPASPGLASQQAAMAAQTNWRTANGLGGQSPNPGGMGFAGMGNMSPQELAQVNMANLIVQQQQMAQQIQLQQSLLGMNGMGMTMNGGLSPMGLMNLQSAGLLSPSALAALGSPGGAQRRSPRHSDGRSPTGGRSPNPSVVPGSGVNPDEQIDMHLLQDVGNWLRSLRLHKYTTNFAHSKWQDMVVMTDADLQKMGVSALGARRKLLKVFEVVRAKENIPTPAGLTIPASGSGADTDGGSPNPNDGDESVDDGASSHA